MQDHTLRGNPVLIRDRSPLIDACFGDRCFSLRAKSYLAYGALVLYAIFLSSFILYQKETLRNQFDALQITYERETHLREMDLSTLQVIETYLVNLENIDTSFGPQHVRGHLNFLSDFYKNNIASLYGIGSIKDELSLALSQTYHIPDKRNLENLRKILTVLKSELEMRLDKYSQYRNVLVDGFQARSNSAAMTSLALGLIGLVLLGAAIGLFISRLTRDVHTLKVRTEEIVKGQSGEPIVVNRKDEVGELIESINQLTGRLETNRKALEIERRKYYHQEKMAAIGAVAAGIAHEVGNPIAAISALVEEIKLAKIQGKCPYLDEEDVCKLEWVLGHAERLKSITQEISGFARPRQDERQLLDLNELIRSTCRLMRYDPRWKNIELRLELDTNLPAVNGVGDHLTQVIMNLLLNAADALEAPGDGAPEITVTTQMENHAVVLRVQDNGPGMNEAILNHAQEAFFTTKLDGKGTGLGLSLCHSIVTAHGGRLAIESEPGTGTVVSVFLPLEET